MRATSLWTFLALTAAGATIVPARPSTSPSASPAPARLEVSPAVVLEGDPVSIRIEGLAPGALATVHAQSVARDDDGREQPYSAAATFMADARGAVDLATSAPVTGDYAGADPRGLFWSQRLLADDAAGRSAVAVLHLDDPASVAADREVLTLEVEGAVADRKILAFAAGDSRFVREEVRAAGLVGVFFFEKGAKRRPVVVVLGGSEGGLDVADWIGPKLAARGFAVFGLEYFSPPGSAVEGVPTALKQIPVESLERVRAWLRARPEADVTRLGLVGYSKGSEYALVLAASYDWVRAVVAFAASDYVWQGIQYGPGTPASSWTRAGRDLPFLPTAGTREEILKGRQPGGKSFLARIAKASLKSASPEMLAAAAIPLERSHAALLLVGGGDDQLWDSGASVERLAARLENASYRHPFEALLFPGAGHMLVGTGWRPTTTDDSDPIQNGGTAQADAQAQVASWSRMLVFLRRELGS